MKNNLVRQITLSGLLLSLVIICTRLLSIQNIPIIPFVRISIGPALIVFTSIFIGPIPGLIVGAASDILGIVLFPNVSFGINPLFTVIYGVFGLLPFFIFKLMKKSSNNRVNFSIFTAILGCLLVFVTIFLIINNQVILFGKTYEFLLWHKVLIIGVAALLTCATTICVILTQKYFAKKGEEYEHIVWPVAITCLVVEFFVMLIANSIVKAAFFDVNFLFIFFAQAVVFFIDIPLNTLVVSYLYLAVGRMLK